MTPVSGEYRYILRYTIDPSFHPEDRIEELARFCAASRIPEVMLFFTAEELNPGHPTPEQYRPWLATARAAKARLARDGVAVSLNPWTTTHHTHRGRTLHPGQDFTTMVGPNGAVHPLAACPLCLKWQVYIGATFAEWARELKPAAIWIEDDFRLHNHDVELDFGGCFCALHMGRFARLVGRPVTREEVVANVVAPGPPHPWRRQWLELWRATMIEAAVAIRAAVRAACPDVRLGLMSSNPDVHSIEDRDWHALQDAFGVEPAFLTRPNLPPYYEGNAVRDLPSVTRHTLANLKRPLDVYPEMENDRCGRYSKSAAFSVWECLHSVCYGARGITINHYDMMGNGTLYDPGFGDALRRALPRLTAVAALGIDDARSEGVRVLFHPRVAMHRVCRGPDSAPPAPGADPDTQGIWQLLQDSSAWSRLFFTLGIAHGFSSAAGADGRPVAANAQTLRAFGDAELKRLLAGPLLLDAEAADTLLDRGFAAEIGIASARWVGQRQAVYSYEFVCEDDPSVYGVARPRMTAQICAARLLAMDPHPGASVRTWICRPDHAPVCPGLIVFRNRLGGRVATLAYPAETQRFQVFFANAVRAALLRNLLFEIAPDAPLATAEPAPIHIYRAPAAAGLLLAVLNPTHDAVERVSLRLGAMRPGLAGSTAALAPDGEWRPARIEETPAGPEVRWTIPGPLGPLDAMFLLAPQ